MAHCARVIAPFALLLGMAAMRAAARDGASAAVGPEDFASAPADDFPSAATRLKLADSAEFPPDAADFADASMAAGCELPPAWLACRPVHGSNFHVAFEAVSLTREIDDDRVFATLDTPTNDVLNANDLSFHQEPGMRLTVGAWFTKCLAAEITYMTVANWDDAAAVSDSTINIGGTEGNLFSPFTGFGSPPEVGLDFNNLASIRLISSLDTLEWNLRHSLTGSDSAPFAATAIYGFRYLALDERLDFRTESTLPLPDGTINTLDIEMNNHLFGFQLGAALDFRMAACWINLEGKAAICHNAIFEDVNFMGDGGGNPPSEPIDRLREEGTTAFVGHLLATIEFRFSEHWVARAGYQALIVDGLALASRSAPDVVLQDATATFHGPIAGLVATW